MEPLRGLTAVSQFRRFMSGSVMVHQVVGPPVGAVIRTFPVGGRSVRVGNVAYSQCAATYYQRVGSWYRVVVLR